MLAQVLSPFVWSFGARLAPGEAQAGHEERFQVPALEPGRRDRSTAMDRQPELSGFATGWPLGTPRKIRDVVFIGRGAWDTALRDLKGTPQGGLFQTPARPANTLEHGRKLKRSAVLDQSLEADRCHLTRWPSCPCQRGRANSRSAGRLVQANMVPYVGAHTA